MFPFKVCSEVPSDASQSFNVLSSEADKIHDPSGEKHPHTTPFACPKGKPKENKEKSREQYLKKKEHQRTNAAGSRLVFCVVAVWFVCCNTKNNKPNSKQQTTTGWLSSPNRAGVYIPDQSFAEDISAVFLVFLCFVVSRTRPAMQFHGSPCRLRLYHVDFDGSYRWLLSMVSLLFLSRRHE